MAKMTQAEMEASWQQYQAQQNQNSPQSPQVTSSAPTKQKMTPEQMEASWQAYQASQAAQSTQPASPAPTTQNLAQSTTQPLSQPPSATDQYRSNFSNIMNKVNDEVKSAAIGAAKPFIDAGAQWAKNYFQNPLQSLVSGKKPVNVNIDYPTAPDQTTADLAGLGSSFYLPGGGAMKVAKSFGGQLATAGGLGALYGNVFGDPNNGVLENSVQGAALPAVFAGLGRALPAFIGNRLGKIETQSKRASSEVRTPQEVQEILAAQKRLGMTENPPATPFNTRDVQGFAQNVAQRFFPPAFGEPMPVKNVPMDIGTLTNQPGYASIYKEGSRFPWSGQMPKMQESVAKTNKAANETFEGIFGAEPPSIEGIKQGVQNSFAAANKQSKANYDDLFNTATQAGLTNITIDNTAKEARKIMSTWNTLKSHGGSSVLDKYPEVATVIDKFAKPLGKVDPATGKRSNGFGLDELQARRTEVGKALDDLPKDAPKSLKDMLRTLYNSMDTDIAANIKKTGNPELQAKWENASSYYKDNVLPFRDAKISKVFDANDNSEGIVQSLLNNREILNLLPPEMRKQILGRKMLNSVDKVDREPGRTSMNVNSAKFIRAYNNLDKSQKQLLDSVLTPEERSRIEDLRKVYESTAPYRSQVNKPENGVQVKDTLAHGAVGAAMAEALLNPHIAMKALGSTAGALGGNKGLLGLLSNPEVARAYANPVQRSKILNNAFIPSETQANPGGLAYWANMLPGMLGY